ncbi:recombinase family protein [Cellulomonas sp. ATA003]|uniref:recombinase family protein n=1 Tax=Cellulomonas sp. ATA003 TaxID=3073064 RepID=UPI0028730DF8|nr:recombinase family protein [Cellulomonas sp. ATA003]WNB85774.1 recombinase family protein [Cellulomonas sp. ATA003]
MRRLDRLGRFIRHLIDQLQVLADRGVGFRSLQETIDTTSPAAGSSFTSSPAWPPPRHADVPVDDPHCRRPTRSEQPGGCMSRTT